MDWLINFLTEFPQMSRQGLRDLKKMIDGNYREFSREYGESIESFFDPLLWFLVKFEELLQATPWPIVILVVAGLAWWGARRWTIVIGSIVSFLIIGWLGMWEDTMSTLAIVSVSTFICIALGIPLGILMARSDRLQAIVTPVLDIMQTIPAFVYLIPVVMLLGIGKVPGLLSVCIYAIPPIVRLTNLGIRLVEKEALEAADAFGASYKQRLFGVQIPLALPNIFAGVNPVSYTHLTLPTICSV